MGIFDNLDQTEVFEKSQYFQPGQYLVKIRKVMFKEGFKGESFIIECDVLGAESDDDDAPQVGSLAAHVWNTSNGKQDIARSTWMQFLSAASEKKQKELSGDQWAKLSQKVLGDDQPLTGKVMRLDAFHTKTKADKDFTVHKWLRPATEEDLAQFGVE